MELRDKGLNTLLNYVTEKGSGRITPAGAHVLIESAKDPIDLKAILDSFGGNGGEGAQIIRDHLCASAQPKKNGSSPMRLRVSAHTKQDQAELRDTAPHHHQAFDRAFSALSPKQHDGCAELGITSLATFQFVHANQKALTKAQITLVTSLHAKICACRAECPPKPNPEPVRTPKIDMVGYGEFRRPRAPVSVDPLVIGMTDVVAGSTIEIRNRSHGISSKQTQPWVSLPVDTYGARAEDGRLHIAVGAAALDDLNLQAWDQFEIRQRMPDGRISESIVPDLGTERSAYQLPGNWNDVTPVKIGRVSTPPGSIFHGFVDSQLVELNPRVLDQHFCASTSGPGTFEVSASVPDGAPFAEFVEPRARVYLKNLSTGEQSEPVNVATDGTFVAAIPGASKDAYEMHVYDQGRSDAHVPAHRILTFAGAQEPPIVAYAPDTGVPEAVDLIMGSLSAQRGCLRSDCGITSGSVVTVTDLETNEQTKVIADRTGSIEVPAQLSMGRSFEIRVENPYTHAKNQMKRDAGETPHPQPGLERTVRVKVGKGNCLTPVGTDQFPPSESTGHVRAASLDDRVFDANVDLAFVPKTLNYVKNSRGCPTGGLSMEIEPSEDIRAHGSINTERLILSRDGSKLQITLNPQLSSAIGMPEGEGERFGSWVGPQIGSGSTGDLRFSPGQFLNGHRKHIDVELMRPDGSLFGTCKLRPKDTSFSQTSGEQVDNWAFSEFKAKSGKVPLLDLNGDAPGDVRAPNVGASAWIEPSQCFKPGAKLSKEQIAEFRSGNVAGRLMMQLDVRPPQGYSLNDVAALEIVNINDHPKGFLGKKGIERVKVNAKGGETQRTLLDLTQAATCRLGVHLEDLLQFRVVMNDGTVGAAAHPVKIETPAARKDLTVNDCFISAGVTTRWTQKKVGETYEGTVRRRGKDGKRKAEQIVMAPPPKRSSEGWQKSVKFEKLPGDLVEMTWDPTSTPTMASFQFSTYTTQNPYNNGGLYSGSSHTRGVPRAGQRTRVVFRDPGPHGVLAIGLGNKRVIYPERMRSDPRVQKLFKGSL